jgi:hypothetical protein
MESDESPTGVDTLQIDLDSTSDNDVEIASIADAGAGDIEQASDDDNDWEYTVTEGYVTYMVREEEDGSSLVIYIPEEETDFNVYISAGVSADGAGVIPVVTDNSVESYSDNNLAMIGGTCINGASAKQLTGSEDAVCGPDFTALTGVGAGEYLIDVAASVYNAEKLAVVIAGYNAPDTENAVDKFMEGDVAIEAGTSEVFPQAAA